MFVNITSKVIENKQIIFVNPCKLSRTICCITVKCTSINIVKRNTLNVSYSKCTTHDREQLYSFITIKHIRICYHVNSTEKLCDLRNSFMESRRKKCK